MSEPGAPTPTPPTSQPPTTAQPQQQQPLNPYAQPGSQQPFPQPRPYVPGPDNPWITEEPPRPQGTNGFAIAALVLGILGAVPLAIVFGIIALVQIGKRNQQGKGLAIGGLSAAGAWVLLFVAGIVLAAMDQADRDSTGEITDEGSISTYALEVGDCLNGIVETEDDASVSSFPAVPCAEPHEGEVYLTFELPEGDYPGEEAVFAAADEQCNETLMNYSPSAYDDPTIGIFYLYPQEMGWPRDREIVCIAYSMESTLTGTIADQPGI